MKGYLAPADETGCGYYRMEEPARVASEKGIELHLETGIPALVAQTPTGPHYKVDLPELEGYDFFVTQRPADERIVAYLPEMQKAGIAVVIELDDDMSHFDLQHPGRAAWEGKVDPTRNWRNVLRACQMADLVICTTPALAKRFAPHGRVAILENCVPEAMALASAPERTSEEPTLGWTGVIHTHPGDLEVTHGGVQLALEGTDWRFLKIGGGAELVQRRLGLRDRPDQTGPLDLAEYQKSIGLLDIGIVPLVSNTFNASKSYLKGIEYAAAGVPFVASPVAEYERLLVNSGLGQLAKDRGRNWKSALRSLMNDEKLRQEISEESRAVVLSAHTYEVNAQGWIDAWEQAILNRKAALA